MTFDVMCPFARWAEVPFACQAMVCCVTVTFRAVLDSDLRAGVNRIHHLLDFFTEPLKIRIEKILNKQYGRYDVFQ